MPILTVYARSSVWIPGVAVRSMQLSEGSPSPRRRRPAWFGLPPSMGSWHSLIATCGNVRWGVGLGNYEVPVRSWFRSKLLNAREKVQGWLCHVPPSDYRRWWETLASVPPALTIETDRWPVGVFDAEAPPWSGTVPSSSSRPVWTSRTRSCPWGMQRRRMETPPGSCQGASSPCSWSLARLRALVHGHWPVKEVALTLNRRNVDTGAGIGRCQRLSLLQVNAAEMQVSTFDVHER